MEGNTMKMRLVVLATITALAVPAFAEGVENKKDDEQKIIESTYHWYVNLMSASDHGPAPAKQSETHEVFALVQTSPHHKLGMALKEIGYTKYFVQTVFLIFPFKKPVLTMGVSDHERTNSFVRSQSGPHPMHTDDGTMRKI